MTYTTSKISIWAFWLPIVASCQPQEPDPGTPRILYDSGSNPSVDSDSATPDTSDTDTFPGQFSISSTELNDGYGSTVAVSGIGVWAGAPHGDVPTIYAISSTGSTPVVQGEGRLGASLIATQDGFVAGAPLANESRGMIVDQDGQTFLEDGQSTGLAVAADSIWVAAGATGWTDESGQTFSSEHRPASISICGEKVGLGFPHGTNAALLDGISVQHEYPHDEMGFSLACGDLDGDANTDWVVGAPGSNTVYRLEESDADTLDVVSAWQSTGRFGHAVAVADIDGDGFDDVIIGAPMTDDHVTGAVSLFLGSDLETPAYTWKGALAGEQAGFGVAMAEGVLAFGAPGGGYTTGTVTVVPWQTR